MFSSIRERIEHSEVQSLSQFATLSRDSEGREREEEPDPIRTCFQRDRDRILHSKSFRRLKHKTQVLIDPMGDHYRTRLTHTLEVSQIARTIARALRLNEDLTEAIALGHDVGHTPFGHAGEAALDDAMREQDESLRFRHYLQSVRVLSVIEDDGNGLNLTRETIRGIDGHSKGRADLTAFDGEFCPSLEAAVVRVSDRIAYLNHDLDDAIRAGWLSFAQLPNDISELGNTHSLRVGKMVQDLVCASGESPFVTFSPPVLATLNSMKEYLFENFYLEYPKRFPDIDKSKHVVRTLFIHYLGTGNIQDAVDYVSGMTDRFAIRDFNRLFVPTTWAE